MVFLRQGTDKFAGHNQCFFVGKTYLLTGFDGMYSGRKSRKTDHSSKHHVYRTGLYNLVECLFTGVYLNICEVFEQRAKLLVVRFVGDNHGSWPEFACLLCELFHAVVGRKAIDFVKIRVLIDDVECLRTDRTGRA